jgi:hypothetical protein
MIRSGGIAKSLQADAFSKKILPDQLADLFGDDDGAICFLGPDRFVFSQVAGSNGVRRQLRRARL